MASDKGSITRLHISPLTPDLLLAALGPQLLATAANVTFHSVQTAPDRPFGYVDLPSMEADKAKKRLHGAILKGKKMKVEDARPKKRRHGDVADSETTAEQAPSDLPAKRPREKRAADRNTLPGHELSPERKVKRGWTEPKASSSKKDGKAASSSKKDGKAASSSKKDGKTATTPGRPVSKFTDKEELLFRTKLPDNKADLGAATKKARSTKAKKTRPSSHTVHEFERNTVEPTFLKHESRKGPDTELHFVDGQGWVDDEGNVVEKEPANLLQRRKAKRAKASLQPDKPADPVPPTPEDAALDNSPQLHPLEAIFKKPQKPASSAQDVAKPSLEVQTSFSFFDSIADDDVEDESNDPPLTPFTSQDMRFRGLRSAAPTPDTAHPSRFNSYTSTAQSGDEGSQSDQDEGRDATAGERQARTRSQTTDAGASAPQESPFAKAFWEKRGENGRAWKARRRTVLKEKRQRENRAQRPKNWDIKCDFELTPAKSALPCRNNSLTPKDEKPIPSASSANGSNASPVLRRASPFDAPDLLSTRDTTDLAITDLKLLHHYTTVVAPELSSPRKPESLVMWQVDCVQLGFKYDFLLHGLLAVAAFEMCQSHPDQRPEYEVLASHHQSLALVSYREILQDVNVKNCHAVCAFSCVLIVMAFASSTKEQPSDFSRDILQWFYLLRGANTVLNMHADTIRSSFLKPLITEMDTVKTTPTYTISNTDRISDLFRICGISNHDREVAQAYTLAIHSLLSTFTQVSICRNSGESPVLASFVWPITLHPQFLDLLSEKQPEALVILAHYCVVIYWGELDNTWFLRGWASYMLETIKQSIPENWQEHLKWPDEIIK
ncbi:hypothetical protein DV737_g330, partial [Chaetothyriales sp. CBS 132003]